MLFLLYHKLGTGVSLSWLWDVFYELGTGCCFMRRYETLFHEDKTGRGLELFTKQTIESKNSNDAKIL